MSYMGSGVFGKQSWAGAGAVAPPSNAEEIAFLTYRLDVLAAWPPSEQKSTLITATVERLRSLGCNTGGAWGVR